MTEETRSLYPDGRGRVVTVRDPDGREVECTAYGEDGAMVWRNETDYRQEEWGSEMTIRHFDSAGKQVATSFSRRDRSGELTETVRMDELGRVTDRQTYDFSQPGQVTYRRWNRRGKLVEQWTRELNGS